GPEKPAPLKVVVKDIKAKEKPDVEELATTLGYDDWQAAELEIRKSLQAELDAEVEQERREEFIDKLVAQTEFEVPGSLIERRKGSLLENLVSDLQQRGMNLQTYLATLEEKGTRDEFESELQETAEKGVKRDLVLERLLEVRGSAVSNEEFTAALRHLAQRRQLDLSRFRHEMGDAWLENYRFLLNRDKAVLDSVKEIVGEAGEEAPVEAAPEPAEEAAEE
ncbi:MAG TPA: hypothetical protein VF171_00390, partial [Trueperaceae bacterium]